MELVLALAIGVLAGSGTWLLLRPRTFQVIIGDGLKEWQIFLFVYMPVMRSTYAAATIIVFMANWNNYLWPLIVLQTNEMKTLTLVVAGLTSAYTPDYGVVMVGAIFATLPTLIIFFLLQRRFVEGMLGAVK